MEEKTLLIVLLKTLKKTIREIVEHIVSYRNAPQASEELSSEDEKIKRFSVTEKSLMR